MISKEKTLPTLETSEMAFIGYICQWSGHKIKMLLRNCQAKDKNSVSFMRDFNSSDLVDPKAVHMVRFVVRNSSQIHQEWMDT